MEPLLRPLNYVRGNENHDPFPGCCASRVSGAALIRGPSVRTWIPHLRRTTPYCTACGTRRCVMPAYAITVM
jgi:hypothetical protein